MHPGIYNKWKVSRPAVVFTLKPVRHKNPALRNFSCAVHYKSKENTQNNYKMFKKPFGNVLPSTTILHCKMCKCLKTDTHHSKYIFGLGKPKSSTGACILIDIKIKKCRVAHITQNA